jgi:transposase
MAAVLVDKYDDGLPLHRQKQRFERMGLCCRCQRWQIR